MQLEMVARIADAKTTETSESIKIGDCEVRVKKLTDQDDFMPTSLPFERLLVAYNFLRTR